MGFRMNIPLPGPFSYSVGAPKVGRAVRTAAKAGKGIAKDARKCREARDASIARQPRCATPRAVSNDSGAGGGIFLALFLLTLVILVICAFGGFQV